MKKYILRLDDACEQMDISKWDKVEMLLDKYGVKPLVGVIPHCEDPEMKKYEIDNCFWEKVKRWNEKGWEIALHGYNHVYTTSNGGLNPVNDKSEFAGVALEIQKEKIRKGINIFLSKNVKPRVFFAPAHTFDINTLKALREESDIRIISDTIARDIYKMDDFVFVPQQSGKVRKLPFKVITFCYHPNYMSDIDFVSLEKFLTSSSKKFVSFPITDTNRTKDLFDIFLNYLYRKIH